MIGVVQEIEVGTGHIRLHYPQKKKTFLYHPSAISKVTDRFHPCFHKHNFVAACSQS